VKAHYLLLSSSTELVMQFPLVPLLFAGLCLVPCSWSHALQNTPIVVSAVSPAATGDAELYYNPVTGELIVATNGVGAVIITAQSNNPYDLSTVNPNANGAFFVPGFETVLQFSAENFEDNQLVAFGLDPALPTGVHNLGALLSPGALTPEAFIADFGDIRLDRIVIGQPLIQPSGVVRILIPDPMPIDVEISDGEDQRSLLREIDVTLPGDVQIDADAFSIVNRNDNSISPAISFTTELVNGSTVATLTFSGDDINGSGSLPDGNYELTINGDLITNAQGIVFDADGDGTPGGQLVIGDQAEDGLFRFFGDSDGDRDTDGIDAFLLIGTIFVSADEPNFNGIFDFDGDDDVDGIDAFPFINNIFQMLPF